MSVNGTKILALNSDEDGYVPLKTDTSGRLECSVNEIEITAQSINLSTDGLETLQTAMSAKLTDIDNSVIASSAVVAKLNLIETTNNANEVLLTACSAKLTDVDNSVLANAPILRPYLIEGNVSTAGIKSGVDSLSACCAGSEVQVDIVSGTISLPSGASTSANQATVIGHLDGVETSLTAITGYVDGIETLIGTTNSSIATMDAVMDNILTKNTEIDTVLDTISGKITACNTGAVVISSGAVTATLSATDNNVLDAIATDGDAIQTLLTTMDGVLDSSLTKQGEIDAVLDTINGKITACNTGAVVISSGAVTATLSATDNNVLDAIDAVLDTIKVDTEAIETAVETLVGGGTTGEWLASASLADTTYSAVLDCSAFKTVRFMGVASATIGMTGMPLMGSQTSGGTYYALQASEKITESQVSIGGVTKYMLSAVIEHTPKFLKIYNNTGGSKTFELDYVGYVN